MASGGARQGQPGETYSNRTDLNTNKMPVTTAPSQQYGSRTAQEQSQQAVPMGPAPGSLTPLSAPTERPGEPITAGLPTGPGPGPEVLPLPPPGQMADRYRRLIPIYEYLASQPGADPKTRNFVRRLRGSLQ